MTEKTTLFEKRFSTGLCDKNGKEIWEKDKMQSMDGLRIYYVKYEKTLGRWILQGIGRAWNVNEPIWHEYEIIGNIHDKEKDNG